MAAFVDSVRINVRGGAGGAGVTSFVKRRGRPKGKPIGGSGGRGGDLWLEADPSVASLLRYDRQPHWAAGDGTHGEGDLRAGKAGGDLVLPVPLGTVVRSEDGTLLGDLVDPGQRLRIARGGRGGKGNAAFVAPERKAPGFAEQGEYGDDRWVQLELKLMADAAIVGYPNAGKSTFIARVSAARPKIADYPFTTLEPNLGVVAFEDRELILADIPGLVEGAADGKGLGHQFLRHTERARAIVLLLDPSHLQTDTPARQHEVLVAELGAHASELAKRPRIVILGKKDDPGFAGVDPDDLAARIGSQVIPMSAITGEGVDGVLHAIADAVAQATREAPGRDGFVLHRPLQGGFTVQRTESGWLVEGKTAERAVNLDDLTAPDAALFAAKRLAAAGVDDALVAAGARPGDDVRIGDIVFTFAPDVEERGS